MSNAFGRLALCALLTTSLAAPFDVEPSGTAHAATTFVVNSTVDEPDGQPGDGRCSSAPSGACTLRAAVMETNAHPGPDTIVIQPGTYYLSRHQITLPADDTSADGDLDVTSEVTIRGASARTTMVALDLARFPNIPRIRLLEVSALGSADISGVSFVGGWTSWSQHGAGIANYGRLRLRDSALLSNHALEAAGGGLFNGAIADLENVTIAQNVTRGETIRDSGGLGGGIANGSGATLMLRNVTLHQNFSDACGGAISNEGTVSIVNATISNNDARASTWCSAGQSLFNKGRMTIENSIVSRNGGDNCLGQQIESLGHNVESGDTCRFAGPADLSRADPQLGPFGDNGGPTDTRGLLPGSPAIDRGQDATCPVKDQRGAPRPQDGNADGFVRCDIGAFEHQPSAQWLTCEPRPPVRIAVTQNGQNALLATITATDGVDGAPNRLWTLRFGRVTNATIEIDGQTGLGANQVVPFPGGRTQTTFVVRRGSQWDAATVELEVVDGCGLWKTFVGGGRDAWGGSGAAGPGMQPIVTPTASPAAPPSPAASPQRRISAPAP